MTPTDTTHAARILDDAIASLDPAAFSSELRLHEGSAVEKLQTDWKVHRWRYLKTASLVPLGFTKLCEVGCNNGILAATIAMMNPNSQVTAIDNHGPFARLALEFAKFAAVRNLEVFQGDARVFWLDADCVTMCEVLEHLEESDARKTCQRLLSAVMVRGGGALITVPNRDMIPSPGHLHEFDEAKLEAFVRPHAFEWVDLHPRHLAVRVRVG